MPGDPTSASRARSKSPPLSRTRVRSMSPPQGQSRQTIDSRATQRTQSVRSIAPSPPVPALRKPHDPAPEMESDLGNALDAIENHGRISQRARRESQEPSHNRPNSPPIPALKHRPQVDNDYSVEVYNYENYNTKDSSSEHKDRAQSRGQSDINGQFVPFVRSTNVLDPAHAESPVPMSRENTAVSE